MGSLVLAFREINQVEHVGREAEAVAELLNEHTDVHRQQTRWLYVTEIDIHQVGQGNGTHHGPQPFLQSTTGGSNTTKDTTDGQSDNTHRTISPSHLLGCKRQSTFLSRIKHERTDQFHQLRLGQTIE